MKQLFSGKSASLYGYKEAEKYNKQGGEKSIN